MSKHKRVFRARAEIRQHITDYEHLYGSRDPKNAAEYSRIFGIPQTTLIYWLTDWQDKDINLKRPAETEANNPKVLGRRFICGHPSDKHALRSKCKQCARYMCLECSTKSDAGLCPKCTENSIETVPEPPEELPQKPAWVLKCRDCGLEGGDPVVRMRTDSVPRCDACQQKHVATIKSLDEIIENKTQEDKPMKTKPKKKVVYRSDAEKQKIIHDFLNSPLSKSQFVKENKISFAVLDAWLKKAGYTPAKIAELRDKALRRAAEPSIPEALTEPVKPNGHKEFEVMIDGIEIKLVKAESKIRLVIVKDNKTVIIEQ